MFCILRDVFHKLILRLQKNNTSFTNINSNYRYIRVVRWTDKVGCTLSCIQLVVVLGHLSHLFIAYWHFGLFLSYKR